MTPFARVATLGIALSLLVACGAQPGEPTAEAATARTAPPPRAVRVEVVELEPSSATLDLDLPGEVTGLRDATLAAANGGLVEAVLVEEGVPVSRGTVLVRVDTALYSAQLDQADAQLDQARADLRRLETLGDLGSDAQLMGAKTQVRVAEANRSLAATRLSRAAVKAPFDGVVANVGVEVGEAVPPGGAVARLIQLDPAVVSLSVSDRDVVALAVGAPVRVSTAALSGQRDGVVARISPAADMSTRAFPVEVEVDNADRALLPGMIARVTAERDVASDAVVIPQDWIVTIRERQGVFVTRGDVAEWRDIVLGSVIHDKVIVRSGVQPGDRIVITGHRDLVDGDPLIVSREGRCCSKGRPDFGK